MVALKWQDLQDLFSSKLDLSRDAQERPIIDKLLVSDVHIFHLSKIAGDREMRERYRQSDLEFDDLLMATPFPKPLKPSHIPYMFFFMDSERSFEACL